MRFKRFLNEGISLKVNKDKKSWKIFKDNKPVSKKYTDKKTAIAMFNNMKRKSEADKKERQERRLKPDEYKSIAKDIMKLLKTKGTITKRDIKHKDMDRVDKALAKMEREGIIQADVQQTYDTVSISTGHFGGKTSLRRKRKRYKKI